MKLTTIAAFIFFSLSAIAQAQYLPGPGNQLGKTFFKLNSLDDISEQKDGFITPISCGARYGTHESGLRYTTRNQCFRWDAENREQSAALCFITEGTLPRFSNDVPYSKQKRTWLSGHRHKSEQNTGILISSDLKIEPNSWLIGATIQVIDCDPPRS